jgi:hypothetical protein
MIIEDYVSFETAKLLKEKGFDEYCRAEWLEYIDGPSKGKTYLAECSSGLQHNSCSNTSLKKFNYDGQMYYAAPTLQMAMKWLREVHNIIITMDYDEYELEKNDTKQVGYGWNIQKIENPTKYLKISNHVFDTYEESCEDAIEYCLTNLI